MSVVFVMGAPGAGKGTQCERLAREFGWVHLSAGALLRAECETDSAWGVLIGALLAEGRMIPSSVTVRVLLAAMAKSPPGSHFLIDGFPRSLPNKAVWDGMTTERPLFCLHLECPAPELERRLLARARADDTPPLIRRRLQDFTDVTLPAIRAFGGALVSIDADRPPDTVWEEVLFEFRARI